MEKIKNITIITLTLIVMFLLLLKGCEPSKTDLVTKPAPVYHIDSIITEYVKIPNEVITYKTIYKPKEVLIYKTITSDSSVSKETREYNDSVKENNITTHYKAVVIGKLQSLDLSTEITDRTKELEIIYRTKTETKEVSKLPKWMIYTGLSNKGNKTSYDFGPYLMINHKKISVSGGYYLLNNEAEVKIGYNLWYSKR